MTKAYAIEGDCLFHGVGSNAALFFQTMRSNHIHAKAP